MQMFSSGQGGRGRTGDELGAERAAGGAEGDAGGADAAEVRPHEAQGPVAPLSGPGRTWKSGNLGI